jgi:hypothetical protein
VKPEKKKKMGRYGGPYQPIIVGIHVGLYLGFMLGRIAGPYQAIIAGIHVGLYLALIMGWDGGP